MDRSTIGELSRFSLIAAATFAPRHSKTASGTMMMRSVTKMNDQSHEAFSPLPKITGSSSLSTNKA
jgi:hypothetical protein